MRTPGAAAAVTRARRCMRVRVGTGDRNARRDFLLQCAQMTSPPGVRTSRRGRTGYRGWEANALPCAGFARPIQLEAILTSLVKFSVSGGRTHPMYCDVVLACGGLAKDINNNDSFRASSRGQSKYYGGCGVFMGKRPRGD